MIKGYCRTNLDDCKGYKWPDEFVEVPRIGDRVQAREARNGFGSCLKVVGVTHLMIKNYSEFGSEIDNHGHRYSWEPRIEVELNK